MLRGLPKVYSPLILHLEKDYAKDANAQNTETTAPAGREETEVVSRGHWRKRQFQGTVHQIGQTREGLKIQVTADKLQVHSSSMEVTYKKLV